MPDRRPEHSDAPLAARAMPRLMAVSAIGSHHANWRDGCRHLVTLVEAGIRWIQLREKDVDLPRLIDMIAYLRQGVAALRPADGLQAEAKQIHVVLNHPRALELVGAPRPAPEDGLRLIGLHLPEGGMHVATARRAAASDICIGRSVHSVAAARDAAASGADYLVFSPIYAPSTKPVPGVGLDALRSICQSVALPVYALGGITPTRAAACRAAGAYGVAVLSGLMTPQQGLRSVVARYLAATA